jgi:PPK2 family polyphosphate:nucleotide phosphotransferase
MDAYRVKPGNRIRLKEWDPNDQSAFDGDKQAGKQFRNELAARLAQFQEMIYAGNQHRLLVIMQGMDTSGKDGAISHVFRDVDPQGLKIANFKVPSAEELAHDYLWRIHRHTPGKGEIAIFNRSHYEDVLVVRVHSLVPKEIWSRRFDQINNFEKLLAEEGTTFLKFFLNIDQEEQKRRLQARLGDPTKIWKFRLGDLKERERWSEYVKAYEDVLSRTSTAWAPWFIVPANQKWYRDIVISTAILDALVKLGLKYPQPEEDLSAVVIE